MQCSFTLHIYAIDFTGMAQEIEGIKWYSTTRFTFSLALVISFSLLLLRSLYNRRPRSPYALDGNSLFNAWSFFTKRYDFLNYNFKTRGLKMFEFSILKHRIVAVSGEEARKIFFTEHSLFLGEGYKMLSGVSPALKDINIDNGGKDDDAEFVKRALLMMRKDRIAELLPIMLDDTDQRMKRWGSEGSLNPFKEVYDLVFQMTVRLASCQELCEDTKATDKLMKHFWNFEKGNTPVSLLFPWLPGPAKIRQLWAITRMYTMILGSVKLRRKAEVRTMEAIDLLIEYGDTDQTIVGTILGIIFAGLVNTGMNSCWALIFLGSHPEWKEKVKIEAQALIAANTNTLSDQPLHKRLATIPVQSWEEEMPIMDSVIRETLRLCVTGAALRRNILKDVSFSDLVVRKGDFVTYLTADVQLNPDLYPEPFKFDPGRYEEGRAHDKTETFGYLSWGAGRHPCAGMKIAKLEMKMVLVLLLVGYDYELVDSKGVYPKSLPEPDRNDTHQAHPIGDTCYLKFKRVIQ